MELSCPNRIFTFRPSSFKFSNIPKRPTSLLCVMNTVPMRVQVLAFERLRVAEAVAVGDCASCGVELLEMEEWGEMLEWGEKCRAPSDEVVELLECLEREAIMGADEGREAVDYNRRAQIFYKSGRVFQALKNQAKDDVEKEEDDDSGHTQD